MSSPTKIIKSKTEARLSKLQNKKNQLENLLRTRERITYEINNLKKSISKDRKQIQKETALLKGSNKEMIHEVVQLEDDEDVDDFLRELSHIYNKISEETSLIFEMLLKYDED